MWDFVSRLARLSQVKEYAICLNINEHPNGPYGKSTEELHGHKMVIAKRVVTGESNSLDQAATSAQEKTREHH